MDVRVRFSVGVRMKEKDEEMVTFFVGIGVGILAATGLGVWLLKRWVKGINW